MARTIGHVQRALLAAIARLELNQAEIETERGQVYDAPHLFAAIEILADACRHELANDFRMRLEAITPKNTISPRRWGPETYVLIARWYNPSRAIYAMRERGLLEVEALGTRVRSINITSAGMTQGIRLARLRSNVIDLGKVVAILRRFEREVR